MRGASRLALLLALAGSLPGALRGQNPAPGASSIVCGIDTLNRRIVLDTLFLWIPIAGDRDSRALDNFRDEQLRAVRAVLDSLPVFGRKDREIARFHAAPEGAPELADAETIVWFQVRNDGRLAGMHLDWPSGWNALDVGVQRAVIRADSLRTLVPLPRSLANQAIDLWFAVGRGRLARATSIPVALLRVAGPLPERTWPRFVTTGYRPNFPDVAARAGIGDSLVMEFIVDTTGHAVPETIQPVRATFREFAEEFARSIRASRFEPGRIGSCAVPTRMQMSMRFLFMGNP